MLIERETRHGGLDEREKLVGAGRGKPAHPAFRRRRAEGAAVARLDALERVVRGRRRIRKRERHARGGAYALGERPRLEFKTIFRVQSCIAGEPRGEQGAALTVEF